MAKVEKAEAQKDYSLYRVSDTRFLQDTFIICSPAAREVLYRPHIAGKTLQDAMEKNASIFASILGKHVLSGAKKERICELVFLSGGLYYALNFGFKARFDFALPQCFIGIQRQRVEGKEGEFRAVAGYGNFESLPDKAHVIIGDTVATGATLVKGIQLLLDEAESRSLSIESISVLTLAGSSIGAQKLARLATTHILPQHPKCKVSFFACEMLFHLMPDGTDLRFLMPDSIMPEESRQEALQRYGGYLAKNMKCAVFDWGTRCKNPKEHYHEFLRYADSELAGNKLDEKGKRVLQKMKEEAQALLKEFEARLTA
ncbi:MAG: hypothetical protein N3G22_01185 [Candidatus Micrarchaeota archaeon]|nr:hypothetical protein [Candidatus Micrarchaeota archaeon]